MAMTYTRVIPDGMQLSLVGSLRRLFFAIEKENQVYPLVRQAFVCPTYLI